MDEKDFKRTISEFTSLGGATLYGYRLRFSLYGASREGGVADVVPATGREVQGVLYAFDDQYLPALDEREGVSVGMYERIEVDVEFEGEKRKAYTYQIIDKAEKEIKPSAYYAGLMLNGMKKYATSTYTKQFKEKLKNEFNLNMKL